MDQVRVTCTAWELHAGRYVEVAEVTGDETVTLSSPYQVTVTPNTPSD